MPKTGPVIRNLEASGFADGRQILGRHRPGRVIARASQADIAGENPLDGPPTEKQEPEDNGEPKRSVWQILTGILLIAVGIPGLVLPVIPGIPMIAGGLVLILGSDHHLVQRAHKWLVDRGWMKPSDLKGKDRDG